MATVLALLLLAAPQGQGDDRATYRPVTRIATASVTIVSAERISDGREGREPEKRDRQVRTRADMALVEFF